MPRCSPLPGKCIIFLRPSAQEQSNVGVGAVRADFTFCRVETGLAGWGGRIRTRECRVPIPLKYRLDSWQLIQILSPETFRGRAANSRYGARGADVGRARFKIIPRSAAAESSNNIRQNDWLSRRTRGLCCGMVERRVSTMGVSRPAGEVGRLVQLKAVGADPETPAARTPAL